MRRPQHYLYGVMSLTMLVGVSGCGSHSIASSGHVSPLGKKLTTSVDSKFGQVSLSNPEKWGIFSFSEIYTPYHNSPHRSQSPSEVKVDFATGVQKSQFKNITQQVQRTEQFGAGMQGREIASHTLYKLNVPQRQAVSTFVISKWCSAGSRTPIQELDTIKRIYGTPITTSQQHKGVTKLQLNHRTVYAIWIDGYTDFYWLSKDNHYLFDLKPSAPVSENKLSEWKSRIATLIKTHVAWKSKYAKPKPAQFPNAISKTMSTLSSQTLDGAAAPTQIPKAPGNESVQAKVKADSLFMRQIHKGFRFGYKLQFSAASQTLVDFSAERYTTPALASGGFSTTPGYLVDEKGSKVTVGKGLTGTLSDKSGKESVTWFEGAWKIRVAESKKGVSPLKEAKQVSSYLNTDVLPWTSDGGILVKVHADGKADTSVVWLENNWLYGLNTYTNCPNPVATALSMTASVHSYV